MQDTKTKARLLSIKSRCYQLLSTVDEKLQEQNPPPTQPKTPKITLVDQQKEEIKKPQKTTYMQELNQVEEELRRLYK